MGFFLTVIYLAVSYLTPEALFGSLAQYHVQLIFAVLTLMFSIPKILRSFVFKTPQSPALLGLAFAGFMSTLVGVRWVGGAVNIFIGLISSILMFFFICLNIDTSRRLRVVVIILFLVCLVVIAHGAIDLTSISGTYGPPVDPRTGSFNMQQWNDAHPYLFAMGTDQGQWFYRIRGLGMINDPNDFAQLLVCMIPLMFVLWHPKRLVSNVVLVIVPVLLLMTGVFLTHSRGALVALTAMAVVAGRRRIGIVPAAILAGCFFAGAMALQFSGGRGISASAGEDRTSLWGQGFATFKTHPLLGVGFGRLPEYTDGYLTAHNSIVVCVAELGLVGFYCWSMFLFATFASGLAVSSPEKVKERELITELDTPNPIPLPFPQKALSVELLDKDDLNRLGRSVFLSLIGFLAAGWFLSRAIVITLFMLGGMTEAIYQMALKRGMVPSRLPFAKVVTGSAGLSIALLLLMYIVIRALNFIR